MRVVISGYRYFSPELGRWLTRDPAEDGINHYLFNDNDGINFTDTLGLWKKDSNTGGSRQIYIKESDQDTLKTLSDLSGLDYDEVDKWAIYEIGGKTNPCVVSVPNVVIVYWAGDMGRMGKWWVDWNDNISNYKSKGYSVEEYNGSSGAPSGHYQNLLHSRGKSAALYGTYFWGHGNKKGLANSNDPHYLLRFTSLKLPYRIAFAHIYACESNSGKTAFNSLKWTGFTGTLYPLNPFDPDWDIPSH